MPQLVQPEFRPTLGDLLAKRVSSRAARLGIYAIAVLALVGVGIFVWTHRMSRTADIAYVSTGVNSFNFYHPPALKPVDPSSNELVRLESRKNGRIVDIFTVQRISFPKYKGGVMSILPIVAGGEHRELGQLNPNLKKVDVLEEGRVRIQSGIGYTLVFRAQLNGKPVFGREVILGGRGQHPTSGYRLLALVRPNKDRIRRAVDAGRKSDSEKPIETFEVTS